MSGCGVGSAPSENTPAAENSHADSPVTPPPAAKAILSVAAASDLKFAMDEMVHEFMHRYPMIEVKVTYGSSGNFFAQLSNKAPFDLFFSADRDFPRKLVEQGHAIAGTEFEYAIGQVVLWVRNDSKLDLETLGIKALLDSSVQKVAIANPKHAPYGKAAEAALRHLEVYDKVSERLVLGENVAQTAQFVESGAADVGLIAHSLAAAPSMKEKGRYWSLPMDSYPRLIQGGVILSWVTDKAAAEEFRSFVTGEPGRAILKQHGFLLPGE